MKTRFTRYWIPVLLWIVFTFLMSTSAFSAENTSKIIEPLVRFLFPSISHHKLEVVHEIVRKSAHITEYCILGLLVFRAFRAGSDEAHAFRWALLSILVVMVSAGGDEFHQTFVPSRGASIVDVGIDTMGGLLAQCVCVVRHRLRRKKLPDSSG